MTLKTFVQFILENVEKFEWTLQGMGLLRLYLPNDCRLHIWDSRYRTSNVSMIHDHLQWGLKSTVLAGNLTNIKYIVDPVWNFTNDVEKTHKFMFIKAGVGCKQISCEHEIPLVQQNPVQYRQGQSYEQQPNEIHRTDAEDGTVTLMQKYPTDTDQARVFWPIGEEWVSAEPRVATLKEIRDIANNALERWFYSRHKENTQ